MLNVTHEDVVRHIDYMIWLKSGIWNRNGDEHD